jgi:hypothetical protein
MSTLDPATLWIYRGLLGLAALALLTFCVAILVWIVGKLAAFTAERRSNVEQSVGWLSGYKTHAVTVLGGLATLAWSLDYLSDKAYFALAGLLGFTAMSTLRSGTAKTEQMAAKATAAADEAASIAATTNQTVRAAGRTPVTPLSVPAPAPLPPPAPVPRPRED